MRILVEVIFLLAGLASALGIASLASWAYPLGKDDIWLVAWGAMAVILLMAIGPLRRAYAEDRSKLKGGRKDG